MMTFNTDSKNIQDSKEKNTLVPESIDAMHTEKVAPPVIPFQLLDKSKKRLTDIYFLLHPQELEFCDPENLAKYYNQQSNQNAPITNNFSDEDILNSINSRYNTSFQDIVNLFDSLDSSDSQLSDQVKQQIEDENYIKWYRNKYLNNGHTENNTPNNPAG